MITQDESACGQMIFCDTPGCVNQALPDNFHCLYCIERMESEEEMKQFCNPVGSWILLSICVLLLLFSFFVVPILRNFGFDF